MINLIPPDAQRYVTMEYWVRVVTVWLFLIAFALLGITIFLVPSDVLIRAQISAVPHTLDTGTTTQSFTALQNQISATNAITAQLATVSDTPLFSQYLDTIYGLAPGEVTVTTVSMARSSTTVPSIVVSGTAATRVALANFRDALAANPAFSGAVLPISNLAKDKDIPFTITVTTVTKPTTI